MEDKLLTITVPTYNIEQYISRCIESFKEVDSKYYSEFEILVINDGSTDNSVKVVEDLAKDSNLDLKVITKENGGHGSTINRGIKEARGKYFKVIDGDDWVKVSDFEKLLDNLKEIDVDMVVADYTEQHLYNGNTVNITFKEELEENEIINDLPKRRIPMHAVTYKTSILRDNNITISEKTFYVDMEYTLLPLKFVKNYIYFNLDVYQYFLGRPDQSMNINVMKQKADHHYRVTKRILDLYSEVKGDINFDAILEDTLKYLINKQSLLFVMNNNKKDVYELFEYANKKGYKWKFDSTAKTTSLLNINFKTKRILSFIIEPLVDKKVKKLGDEYVN